jgi:hypothetical protein
MAEKITRLIAEKTSESRRLPSAGFLFFLWQFLNKKSFGGSALIVV